MENALVNLLNGLDASVFNNFIYCFNSSDPNPPLKARIENSEIPIFSYEKGERLDYWLPVKLSQLLRKESIDIVHARNFAAILYGSMGAKLSGTPVAIGDIRGPIPSDQGQKCRRLSFLLSQFVAVSKDVKRMLTDEFQISPEMVTTVYNGVHMNGTPGTEEKLAARKKLGFDSDDLIIGTIGRVEPVKDYSTLVRASALILKKFAKAKLVIVGGGSQLPVLKELALELEIQSKCIFTDYQQDVKPYLAAFDIFVLTSIFEGISNVLLEAMTFLLPVIATAVGGNPEVVVDDESGFLVTKKDVQSLAAKIEILLTNKQLASQMGENGYRIVREKFTIPKMIENYQKLYLDMLLGG